MKSAPVLNLYVRIPDQLLTTLLEDGMDLTDVYLLGSFRRGLHGPPCHGLSPDLSHPQNRISVWHPAVLLSFQQFRFSVVEKTGNFWDGVGRPIVEIQKFSTLKLLKRLKRTEMS